MRTSKLLCLMAIVFLQNKTIAQTCYQDSNIYVYHTFDDFFSNNKISIGKSLKGSDFYYQKCFDYFTNKKFQLDLSDSNYVGYSYGCSNQKYILYKKRKKFFTMICGNKNLMVVYTCCVVGNFDKDGQLLVGNFTADSGSQFYFIKNLDFANKFKNFESLIEDKPKLYQQYLAEKNEDRKVFWQYHISFYKKYIELYSKN